MKKRFSLLFLLYSTFFGLTCSAACPSTTDNVYEEESSTKKCHCTDGNRPYVSGFGGANWLHFNSNSNFRSIAQTGLLAGGALGFKIGQNSFRIEAEGAFRYNPVRQRRKTHRKQLFQCCVFHPHHHGHHYGPNFSDDEGCHGSKRNCISFWSGMFNFLYQYGTETKFAPYIGLGVGYVHYEESRKKFSRCCGEEDYLEGNYERCRKRKISRDGIGGQVIVGLGYYLLPRTVFGVEYRYFFNQFKIQHHSLDLVIRQAF